MDKPRLYIGGAFQSPHLFYLAPLGADAGVDAPLGEYEVIRLLPEELTFPMRSISGATLVNVNFDTEVVAWGPAPYAGAVITGWPSSTPPAGNGSGQGYALRLEYHDGASFVMAGGVVACPVIPGTTGVVQLMLDWSELASRIAAVDTGVQFRVVAYQNLTTTYGNVAVSRGFGRAAQTAADGLRTGWTVNANGVYLPRPR